MVLTLWSLHPRYTQPPYLGSISSFCTFKINHGGSFTNTVSGRSYIDGLVDHFDFVDMDVFSLHELDDMMAVLGYNDGGIMFYHFMIPKTDLHSGLLPLGTDQEVIQLASKESVSEGPWSGVNMTNDESEDENFFMDSENIVDDVDVDLKEFHIHVDEDVEWVQKTTKEASGSGVDFTQGEYLEVIDPELFESPIVDEDNNRERMLRDIRKEKVVLRVYFIKRLSN
ncbi:unnamed protein product [Lactuca saligna]|uniref:PB1-like domain-containing protein n=1 Tax=Lactuca saligna TaxID=75948 RepID=A0AA35ZE80_LACSI|nr:unnamed protein product [Lactuca saligna]